MDLAEFGGVVRPVRPPPLGYGPAKSAKIDKTFAHVIIHDTTGIVKKSSQNLKQQPVFLFLGGPVARILSVEAGLVSGPTVITSCILQ